MELFYVESGVVEYYIPKGKAVFPAGSGGLVNSNVLHMTKSKDMNGFMRKRKMYLSVEDIAELFGLSVSFAFLTSGSVNVQLVLREVRVEGCLGRVDFRACFQGCVIVVHHVEDIYLFMWLRKWCMFMERRV